MDASSDNRLTVLVVDDDATTRTLIRASLEQSGFRVDDASNGEDAIRRIMESPPEIVLLDVSMPIMGGIEACRRIRKIKEHRSLPVIMVTGRTDAESAREAQKAGATDYVTKPINWRLLGHRVRHLLNMHSAIAQSAER